MIKVNNIKKSFGEPPIEVLHGISFEIPEKQFVSITGKSGSGKSTLLYSMSTLDHPTSGEVFFDGVEIASMSDKEVHEFRNLKMGFIFQFHYLLPELSALENVLMPARRTGQHTVRYQRGVELLTQFGLSNKLDRLPKQLSGGEQQRVAIARALIQEPKYVFADEPTGNLDSTNGEIVMNLLKTATRDGNTTVIYVTHDPDFAALADKRIVLKDGNLSATEF
ncbi:MAG: ABC transporter ATP-binding protein [Bdellovibrionaceae bacterium]|nr:ABC transporter ATP-binding protein [Pseudobdellovibrionaceae bacterium]NUM59053.1 ABC transporter ATP-binding protein [Pseudobdellovibrionaceae bacterium]